MTDLEPTKYQDCTKVKKLGAPKFKFPHLEVVTRKVWTLSAGQFRPLVHDFQVSGIAENPVALARGQFPYDA